MAVSQVAVHTHNCSCLHNRHCLAPDKAEGGLPCIVRVLVTHIKGDELWHGRSHKVQDGPTDVAGVQTQFRHLPQHFAAWQVSQAAPAGVQLPQLIAAVQSCAAWHCLASNHHGRAFACSHTFTLDCTVAIQAAPTFEGLAILEGFFTII